MPQESWALRICFIKKLLCLKEIYWHLSHFPSCSRRETPTVFKDACLQMRRPCISRALNTCCRNCFLIWQHWVHCGGVAQRPPEGPTETAQIAALLPTPPSQQVFEKRPSQGRSSNSAHWAPFSFLQNSFISTYGSERPENAEVP